MFLSVPAVSVAHYLKPKRRYFRFPVDDTMVRATERAQEICSPLYLQPRFEVGKIRVVAHAGDRVCDITQTRLWAQR